MSTIIIANQRGGATKTTTSIHLGAGLAELGRTVLLVDMDPQGHLAEGLGLSALDLEHEISEVLDRRITLTQIIQEVRPNLYLAPSNIRLSYLEGQLISKTRREDRLRNALATIEGQYDFTLIDCPPSLGLLTVNGLSAADYVLIPMAAEFYSMLGVGLLLQTIREMKAEINPELEILGLLPTRVGRTNNARDVMERTKQELSGEFQIFDPIPETVKFREAASAGQTIFEYAPDSPGAEVYRKLAKEVNKYVATQIHPKR
jgi:chromosome partitioning protein